MLCIPFGNRHCPDIMAHLYPRLMQALHKPSLLGLAVFALALIAFALV